jgi:hypothetical protein
MAHGRGPRAKKLGDIALVFGRTEDNEGYRILRRRAEDRPVEMGEVHPLREGKPISGEVVTLKARRDVPYVFDVKTELETAPPAEPPEARATSGGPAQVATEGYRRGWDAIWGDPPPPADRPN